MLVDLAHPLGPHRLLVTLYKASYISVIQFHLKSCFPCFHIIFPGKEKLKTTGAGWCHSFSLSAQGCELMISVPFCSGPVTPDLNFSTHWEYCESSQQCHTLAPQWITRLRQGSFSGNRHLWKLMNSIQWRNGGSQTNGVGCFQWSLSSVGVSCWQRTRLSL